MPFINFVAIHDVIKSIDWNKMIQEIEKKIDKTDAKIPKFVSELKAFVIGE